MITLKPVAEPQWLGPYKGVRFRMKPADTVMLVEARRAANTLLRENGGLADMEFAFAASGIAWGVLEWEGVGNAEGPDPALPTPENVVLLLRQEPEIFDALDLEYMVPFFREQAEKKGSSPSPIGASAAATTTAPPAPKPARSAPTKSTAAKPTRGAGSGKSSRPARAKSS